MGEDVSQKVDEAAEAEAEEASVRRARFTDAALAAAEVSEAVFGEALRKSLSPERSAHTAVSPRPAEQTPEAKAAVCAKSAGS